MADYSALYQLEMDVDANPRSDRLTAMLAYPIAIVEHKKGNPLCGFDVVYSKRGFTTFGRVPNAAKFRSGIIFDCSGQVFEYEGSSGWPRFSSATSNLLDNLLLPGIITKVVECFGYFGPTLISQELLGIETYRAKLYAAISSYGAKDLQQLKQILNAKTTYRSVLEGFEHWRYFGDNRDEDGHPELLENGEINPEHKI